MYVYLHSFLVQFQSELLHQLENWQDDLLKVLNHFKSILVKNTSFFKIYNVKNMAVPFTSVGKGKQRTSLPYLI